jgi:sigma-B regulation protein RsbU (phosphoserine phosphatase)
VEHAARVRIEHVQCIVDASLGHLELDALLGELLDRIRAALAADTCAVLLLDPVAQELVARAAVGIEEEVEQCVRIPFGQGFAGRIAAEARPIGLADVDHAHVLNPLLREKRIKSLLGVPLAVRGHVIGVLHVGTLTPRAFTGADTELLQLVADESPSR